MSSNSSFMIREKIIQALRQFFLNKGFQELHLPLFDSAVPLEPNVYPFSTTWRCSRLASTSESTRLYLPTSPESIFKKILAQNLSKAQGDQPKLDKVFTFGPCFRNLEPADDQHRPEFLMLEWYRAGSDYRQLMVDLKEMVLTTAQAVKAEQDCKQLVYQGSAINLDQNWTTHSLDVLFTKYTDCSIQDLLSLTRLQKLAKSFDFTTKQASWEQLFNQIFVSQIEPHLPSPDPFFTIDYPAKISPMCAPRSGQNHLAERFEFYLAGLELANGNTENLNSEKIEQIFSKEQSFRKKKQLPSSSIDQAFLQAMKQLEKQGMSYAGAGLGVDRLAMILADETKISKVLPYNFTG